MNEQLQQALADAVSTVISAKQFITAELPDCVSQLLLWKAVYSGISMALFVVLYAITIYAATKTWKWAKYDEQNDESYNNFCGFESGRFILMLAFALPIGLLPLLASLDWLQILIAPKVYLIEYAASIAK